MLVEGKSLNTGVILKVKLVNKEVLMSSNKYIIDETCKTIAVIEALRLDAGTDNYLEIHRFGNFALDTFHFEDIIKSFERKDLLEIIKGNIKNNRTYGVRENGDLYGDYVGLIIFKKKFNEFVEKYIKEHPVISEKWGLFDIKKNQRDDSEAVSSPEKVQKIEIKHNTYKYGDIEHWPQSEFTKAILEATKNYNNKKQEKLYATFSITYLRSIINLKGSRHIEKSQIRSSLHNLTRTLNKKGIPLRYGLKGETITAEQI